LIDADLKGLNKGIFQSLAKPLLSGTHDAAIGLPAKAEDRTLFRPLSGERCYYRGDLLPHLTELRDKRYGLELALNYLYRNARVKVVPMAGVSQLHKAKKYSRRVAAARELQTWIQLADAVAWQENPSDFTFGAYTRHFYAKSTWLRCLTGLR
jgi:hypothetical protein